MAPYIGTPVPAPPLNGTYEVDVTSLIQTAVSTGMDLTKVDITLYSGTPSCNITFAEGGTLTLRSGASTAEGALFLFSVLSVWMVGG